MFAQYSVCYYTGSIYVVVNNIHKIPTANQILINVKISADVDSLLANIQRSDYLSMISLVDNYDNRTYNSIG